MDSALKDFPDNTLTFLKKLSKNNNRKWFEENREMFNLNFLEPAVQFVAEMGEKLSTIRPSIIAIPKTDKSIFRIHRDVRFSKDKQPYKTNMGLYFWEGKRKKMECSGFYFHLDNKMFGAGTGMYVFSKGMLANFRNLVANPANGKELSLIIKTVLMNKSISLGGKKFKRIPKGFDPEYPYADFLLHDGLYFWYEGKNDNTLSNGKAVKIIFDAFKKMMPLHEWLVRKLG
jgi:uncharacterized protein (TIGR02453 family)